jgi:hypothetical protein
VWQNVAVDLITKLPISNGYDSITVIVDRLGKGIRVVPWTKHLGGERMARIYRNHIWKNFGLPEVVISDRGTQFVEHFMWDLLKLLGLKSNTSMAYHPQTGGQTEHVNQNIEQYLRVFTNFLQDNWADQLTLAEFNHNEQVSKTTGFSPFFVTMGFHLRKGTKLCLEVPMEDATKFATWMSKVREEAGAAMRAAQETMKRFYDAKRQADPDYKPGDKVYLSGVNLVTHRPTKKFED